MKNTSNKKIMLLVIVIVIILAISACFTTGAYIYYASINAVNQEGRSLEVKKQALEKANFGVEKFETKYNVKEVKIPSSFGEYDIPANYLTIDGNENRDTVVMAHGLNGNRITGYPVAKMFLRNGYNVLTYDQRGSGESKAINQTCGYLESKDLKDCVDYIYKNVDRDKNIGAWGSSIGGGTIGIYLGTQDANKKLNFAILDCPVSSVRDITGLIIKDKVPFLPIKFRLDMGSMVNKIMLGFSYEDGNVCKTIENTQVPVLIFNSKNDKVTRYYMGADLYNAIKGKKKEILTVKDSQHTDIYIDHKGLYEKTMMDFLKRTIHLQIK
ncbi:MAG: alpha/beta fold hydrolase [Anaerovoracaceae bacterium]